jgi:hypothetical protein
MSNNNKTSKTCEKPATDPLLVRARAIHARLLAVWPGCIELMPKYERIMRLLDLWQEPLPLTHADLDKVEEDVRRMEAGGAPPLTSADLDQIEEIVRQKIGELPRT